MIRNKETNENEIINENEPLLKNTSNEIKNEENIQTDIIEFPLLIKKTKNIFQLLKNTFTVFMDTIKVLFLYIFYKLYKRPVVISVSVFLILFLVIFSISAISHKIQKEALVIMNSSGDTEVIVVNNITNADGISVSIDLFIDTKPFGWFVHKFIKSQNKDSIFTALIQRNISTALNTGFNNSGLDQPIQEVYPNGGIYGWICLKLGIQLKDWTNQSNTYLETIPVAEVPFLSTPFDLSQEIVNVGVQTKIKKLNIDYLTSFLNEVFNSKYETPVFNLRVQSYLNMHVMWLGTWLIPIYSNLQIDLSKLKENPALNYTIISQEIKFNPFTTSKCSFNVFIKIECNVDFTFNELPMKVRYLTYFKNVLLFNIFLENFHVIDGDLFVRIIGENDDIFNILEFIKEYSGSKDVTVFVKDGLVLWNNTTDTIEWIGQLFGGLNGPIVIKGVVKEVLLNLLRVN